MSLDHPPYIPTGGLDAIARRDEQLMNAFDGDNHCELATRFRLTINAVYQIIRRAECRRLQSEVQAALSLALEIPVEALWVGRLAQLADLQGRRAVELAAQTAIAAGIPDHAQVVLVALPLGHPAGTLPTTPDSSSAAPAETPPGTPGPAGDPAADDGLPPSAATSPAYSPVPLPSDPSDHL
jgi:hypothetical protein